MRSLSLCESAGDSGIDEVVILSLYLAGVGGCSFVLVDGPPAQVPAGEYPRCTESKTVPVIDLIIAGITASAGLEMLLARRTFEGSVGTTIGIAALAVAAVSAPSGWVGLRRTRECRRLRNDVRDRRGDLGRAPAGEGQVCDPNAGCEPGLVCASGICVRPPERAAPPPGDSP